MRADQQLALDPGGDHFQIICEDGEVLDRVRTAVTPWLTDDQGLPGFKISPPDPDSRLWVLLGSTGAVLARSAESEPIVRTLLRHLSALAAPQAGGTVRVGLAALAGPRGVVLVDPELLRAQPPIERQLERAGLAIVDAPFIELAGKAPATVQAIESSTLTPGRSDIGHVDPSTANGRVAALLRPATSAGLDATVGQIAHALASASLTGSRRERLSTAAELADSLTVELIVPTRPRAVLETARQLIG